MFPFIVFCVFIISLSDAALLESERDERCDAIAKKIELQDKITIEDKAPTRLHSTWVSQECEVRAGPEYVIRKYKFFENGTFLLVRYHYAEESCSVATHTITARGSIELSSTSSTVHGATEAKVRLRTVHLIPLNYQVAHKLERRLNASCGPQPKWRPYTSQLIYERPIIFSSAFSSHGPFYNSLQIYRSARQRRGVDCLESLGIEFSELRLLRVQRRQYSKGFIVKDEDWPGDPVVRVELYLGGLPRNVQQRRNNRITSLQTIPLLRADTATECPICGTVSRATECNPPLLHEAAPLPALIGGLWLSNQCESTDRGLWTKRFFRIYSGDKLWTSRWYYYSDPACSMFLYTITAAGSYVQRAIGHRYAHGRIRRALGSSSPAATFSEKFLSGLRYTEKTKFGSNFKDRATWRKKRDVEVADTYRHILQNTEASMARSLTAILRGNQKESSEPVASGASNILAHSQIPSGTSELELQVAESLLLPGDTKISLQCGVLQVGVPLTSWLKNCVPGTIEAPSKMRFRVKVGVNWEGQYTLFLGSFDNDLWEAPLRRCSATSTRNSSLKAHLGRTLALRYGLFSSVTTSSSGTNQFIFLVHIFVSSFALYANF